MLTLENITKSYFIADEEVKVLDDISIQFPDYGLIGIRGESGCGKSTLLNIIAALEKPDKGKIIFNQEEIDNQYLKKEITIISQNHDLISSLKVKDNITIGCKIAGIKYLETDLKKIVHQLEIQSLMTSYPHQLSGGQKRRVSIARGVLKDASILLADEPTGALHQRQAHEVMRLLKQQAQKRLVILVSHDDVLLEQYCDDILVLEKGKLKGTITKKEKPSKKSEEKKYSLLFYILSSMKSQKYILLSLVVFEMIIITALTLMITGIQGIQYELESYYYHHPKKNIMMIENFDGASFETLPVLEHTITSYDYLLSLGELSLDIEMSILPQDMSHITLKEGRMPENQFEILVSEATQVELGSSLTYTASETYEFSVVGIIQDYFFKEQTVYIHPDFIELVGDYMNKMMVVLESEECEMLYKQLSDDYIVYCDVLEAKESYSSLLNIAIVICLIFFLISMICSFFLFYIAYSTIGERRKIDSAILLMMGLSHHQLFLLFIVESMCIGVLMSVSGVMVSYIIYYYMNEVYMLKQHFFFSLKFNTYFICPYDLYIVLSFAYIILSMISAYIPSRKIAHSHLVSMLREE